MKIDATLVDGVGRTRDLVIHREMSCIRIPQVSALELARHTNPLVAPRFGAVDFVEVGTLPDGRHVYGQKLDPPFTLWTVTASWVEAEDNQKHTERDLALRIDNLSVQSLGPFVRLYDKTTSNKVDNTSERVVFGVGRRKARS